MSFTGAYFHSLDDKGRTIVPAKYREQLGEQFVVTKGLDGCLYVYPLDEWEVVEESFRKNNNGNQDARFFRRMFFSSASFVDVDKQGRIPLPIPLREYAGLGREIVFAGAMNHVEIWDRELWREMNSATNLTAAAERLANTNGLYL